mgnify:CR=1 FL=1
MADLATILQQLGYSPYQGQFTGAQIDDILTRASGAISVPGDDLNNATAAGTYFAVADQTDNMPGNTSGFVTTIVGSAGSACVQEYTAISTNCKARRILQSGVWGEWEWENPPNAMNVEYRLTERLNGAVVYCKTISFGAVSAGVTETAEPLTNLSAAGKVVKVNASGTIDSENGTVLCSPYTVGNISFRVSGSYYFANGTWRVRAYADSSHALSDCIATIYYTKG